MIDIPNPLTPLYFYNNFVLPIYFDDDLDSYQKLLKIQLKINEIISNQSGIINWLQKLKEWVDTQLKLYAQEQLNEWLTDGTLEKIINETIFNELNTKVINRLEVINVKNYGAKGDGVTDDTIAINNAINSINNNTSTVWFPKGTYMIKGENTYKPGEGVWSVSGIILKDNIELLLDNDATLQCITNTSQSSCVIQGTNVNNVYIHGGTIKGDKETHTITSGTTDEWGHGILLLNCSNIRIENTKIQSTMGDGIYIGVTKGTTTEEENGKNIYINNVLMKNISRNGIAACSAYNVNIDSCIFNNVSRTAPKAGIDIEKEGWDFSDIKHVNVSNCSFIDCEYSITGKGGKEINISNINSYSNLLTNMNGNLTYTQLTSNDTTPTNININNANITNAILALNCINAFCSMINANSIEIGSSNTPVIAITKIDKINMNGYINIIGGGYTLIENSNLFTANIVTLNTTQSVSFENCVFDCSNTNAIINVNTTGCKLNIKNCEITAARTFIYVSNKATLNITGNKITGNSYDFIAADAGNVIKIENNEVQNNTGRFARLTSDYNIFTNNKFIGTSTPTATLLNTNTAVLLLATQNLVYGTAWLAAEGIGNFNEAVNYITS